VSRTYTWASRLGALLALLLGHGVRTLPAQDVLPAVQLRLEIASPRYRRALRQDTLRLQGFAGDAIRRVLEERLPVANWTAPHPTRTVTLRFHEDLQGSLFIDVFIAGLGGPDTARSQFETSDEITSRYKHPATLLNPSVIADDWAHHFSDFLAAQTQNFVKVLGELPIAVAVEFDPEHLVYVVSLSPRQIRARTEQPPKFRLTGMLHDPSIEAEYPVELMLSCALRGVVAYVCTVQTFKGAGNDAATTPSPEQRLLLTRGEWRSKELHLLEYWVDDAPRLGLAVPGRPQ
jgi:hypothetical protein